MSQQDGAPQEKWQERDDSPEGRARRKLFRKLTDLDGRVATLDGRVASVEDSATHIEAKLEDRVTWQKLVAILGTAAVVIVSAAWAIVSSATARSETQAVASQKAMADEVRQLRAEVGGVYKYLIEGQPKARVAAEVRETREAVKAVDAGVKK